MTTFYCDYCEKDFDREDMNSVNVRGREYCDDCYSRHYCHFGNHMKDENEDFIDCGEHGYVCETCHGDSDLFGIPEWKQEEPDWDDSHDPD